MRRLFTVLFLFPAFLLAMDNETTETWLTLDGPRIRDSIRRQPTLAPRETCGSSVACSVVAAIASCDCSPAAPNRVLARTTLRLLGTIYYFDGPFASLAKRARDRSVVDSESAIRHEYAYHITPAMLSVAGLLPTVESIVFPSMADCVRAGRELAQSVNTMFRQTLVETQRQEVSVWR
jgi:hypothetical protein